MKTLTKKERSAETSKLKRMLIDFKSLINKDDNFYIYKFGGTIYYIFDIGGFFRIVKKSDYISVEEFLQDGEYVELKYQEIRRIVDLKKSQITAIVIEDNIYDIEINIDDNIEHFIIEKHQDDDNVAHDIVQLTLPSTLNSLFKEASYDTVNQKLTTFTDGIKYPYKITFSDDINFKLKISDPNSKYYIRILSNGTFAQIVTISDYKDIYEAQSMLFVFNYLNNKEV